MAATFDLAKAVFVSSKEMVQLLSQLKPSDFTLSVLHTIIVAQDPKATGKITTRVGIVTGFADLSKQGGNNAVQLIDSSSNIATANVGLVVNFGGVKETVQLGQLIGDLQHEQLLQAEHGMFVQRCQEHRSYLPEPEHLSDIRERLNRGRKMAKQQQQQGSTFTTWKVVSSSESQQQQQQDSRRRQRPEDDAVDSSKTTDQQQQQQLSRLDEKRIQRLQGQIADQLAALSQTRNEVRSLQEQLEQQQKSGPKNQPQQQNAAAATGSGAAATAKLAEVVGTLTSKVQSLNGVVDELVTLSAAKLKVQPTRDAVLAALRN